MKRLYQNRHGHFIREKEPTLREILSEYIIKIVLAITFVAYLFLMFRDF